ncbi:MAG: 50S ribosomal protein L21 [Kiritimatiellae bacterium]|jgi:large subunit ribosomal protein L21|nr:50S ribosomal protein L21 [Kiritimatiellia bacterium]MDD3584828.1 50S ribosomal protein L21 [Kiritimatiellia bacterium]HHU14645.1 50S ribosomal protein L21 [Lentisphaerota bacterium]HON48511.1 50S ribosomal protein L21 [Kiritimatiellia bacterium]
MDAYAVLETGGKQYRVAAGDTIEIERLDVEAGQDVELDTVLACSDGTELKIGMPYVKDAKVTLTIVGHKRGKKLINFKKKRRKGYARRIGHRQELTVATVKAIA